ncbi:MAG: peptide chain release factor N(5)-glutamine methyltransferase [Bacteroidales bacterium]|nr:peptide chain release factor N(5)-glutamine methyltransferase [Bacteroidales bacterium]
MQRFLATIESRLGSIYSQNEIKSIARLLLKQLAGLNSVQIYSGKDTKFPDGTTNILNHAVDQLVHGEPIQYVLGKTEFFGLDFNVRPGVLIPRPETEELVELILKNHENQQIQLLDIGTGSGCIAISLAKNIPMAKVSAWDISREALAIAGENAKLNNVSIAFSIKDIREFEHFGQESGKWDVIVSNPPYVCQSEKAEMEDHVLNHEPHLALFVNDDDPLIFYRHIASYAVQNLKKGGALYVEINSHLGEETLRLIQKYHFDKAELLQDLSGRDRMIKAVL